MTVRSLPRTAHMPGDPWFRRHPRLAVMVACALFAAVLALRLFSGTPVDAYSMLYALPVALVATTAGLRAGAGAGLLGVGLTVLWAVVEDVTLTPTGWASRVVPLLLLGVLLGHATDRERRAELVRRRLQAAALLHREAIEINDSLVQGMVAAKWSLDAGKVDTGTEILGQTVARAHDLVSGLIRRGDMGSRSESLAHLEYVREADDVVSPAVRWSVPRPSPRRLRDGWRLVRAWVRRRSSFWVA